MSGSAGLGGALVVLEVVLQLLLPQLLLLQLRVLGSPTSSPTS